MSQNMGRRGPRGGMGRGPMGGPHGMMPGEKARDFRGAIRRIISYLGRFRYAILIVIVLSIGSTVFSILGPRILGEAVTEIYGGILAKLQGAGGIDFAKVGTILITLLGLYALSGSLSAVQGWLMTGVVQKLCFRLRKEIVSKIHRMPMAFFESHQTGDTLSRITNDVDTFGQSLNQSVTTLISSIVTIIGVAVMMLSISPLMTMIALVILPISMMLVGFVVKKSQKYFVTQQEYLGKINGQVEETYGGHIVVKAFNREEKVISEFMETNAVLYQSAWKSQFISGMMMPIMNFVGNLGYVGVVVSGSFLMIAGRITLGDIQAFIQYIRSFTQPITQFAQVANMLQSMAAAAERVFAFLDEEEESEAKDTPVDMEGVTGRVTFDHVRFGYSPEKIVIGDFSAEVLPGQTVAIVGPTGAGKTTIVKLLMRFYDVQEGAIRVDGQDIRSFSRASLRELFGMVLQDTWLFKGTIMENIRYGRLDATDEEVIQAAKTAHAHHFIQTLPGAYQMELNEDATNVSQGQKQLLTIARAILADKKLLILDEATSSVDTSTEARIQRAMNNLMRGRTSFVIAHRLSTIRDANLILVMRDGEIVEQGTHDALLSAGGFYAELYRVQFEVVA